MPSYRNRPYSYSIYFTFLAEARRAWPYLVQDANDQRKIIPVVYRYLTAIKTLQD